MLRLDVNVMRDSAEWTNAESEFTVVGPAAEKARLPRAV